MLAVFLDRYPGSPRDDGEASATYGWIFVDAGDLAAAEARFRARDIAIVPRNAREPSVAGK